MKKALHYSRKLEEVGLTREQATVHLEILESVVEDEMATKADIQNSESNLRSEIRQLELKMTIKVGLMLATAVGILATLIRLA